MIQENVFISIKEPLALSMPLKISFMEKMGRNFSYSQCDNIFKS